MMSTDVPVISFLKKMLNLFIFVTYTYINLEEAKLSKWNHDTHLYSSKIWQSVFQFRDGL
jgi:hypothetical protein